MIENIRDMRWRASSNMSLQHRLCDCLGRHLGCGSWRLDDVNHQKLATETAFRTVI